MTRILVADGNPDIRDLLMFKLSQEGFEAEVVNDGESALAAITADPPDLALLDVTMPGLTGIDVLRKVRDDERTQGVRVILLTDRSQDDDVDATDADDYVIKPFSPRELLTRVHSVLAQPHP